MGMNVDIVQRGWEAVGRGDWDALVADYTEDMKFIMPGQNNVLKGQSNFRQALEGIGEILPPGFDITSMRHIDGNDEVVTIFEWKSNKIPEGTQSAVLFNDDRRQGLRRALVRGYCSMEGGILSGLPR